MLFYVEVHNKFNGEVFHQDVNTIEAARNVVAGIASSLVAGDTIKIDVYGANHAQ